ncbi:flagellar hook assembly protein FlgD [Roseicella aquatilis]|nr:flagellar hook assembly protein FlgD [Roseicella aquatilis]
MSITTTSTTTAAASGTSGSTSASATASAGVQLAADMQTFLTMLTTQLQNQDPTKPLDPNEFTSQLAQFSAVEQEIAVNQHLDSLIALQRSSIALSAAPLVGEHVEVASSSIALRNGATQALQLPASNGTATTARVVITNAAGTVVRDSQVDLGSSTTAWTWDGRNGTGQAMPNGTYGLAVTGIDSSGTPQGALDFTVGGTVTQVARKDDASTLSIGALSVPIDDLRSVGN